MKDQDAARLDIEPVPPRSYGIAPPGYSLPYDISLGRVRLQVADIERSIEFYERILGLRAARGYGRTVLSASDGVPIVELVERAGAAPVPRKGRLGLYHFAILLPDRPSLGRFLSHLVASGIQPGMSDHFVSEALYLSDPDGLGIEVYADRPRSEWHQAGNQLAMATEPLDANEVMQSGGGRDWDGAPAGTVVGHVHLFVSDLQRAEHFYHLGMGFDKIVWSYHGALFMSAGGYHHHLGTNTWARGAMPAGESDARLLEWSIVLARENDSAALAASLEDGGFSARNDGAAGWLATDPWGISVRFGTAEQIASS
jgi:catechol 2,3-dioxygenase